MKMKNKLYKHHRSKASYLFKTASIFVLGLSAVVLAIAIPTYVSVRNSQNITVKAESETVDSSNEVASNN